jgi:hypothetical protein
MKNKMWSKKTLIPWLIEKGFISGEKTKNRIAYGESYTNVSYEAYGRKVCAYISVKDMPTRLACEDALIDAGQKVSRTYFPGHPTVCVDVTYFKAWHWDE